MVVDRKFLIIYSNLYRFIGKMEIFYKFVMGIKNQDSSNKFFFLKALTEILNQINLSKVIEEKLFKNSRALDSIGRPVQVSFKQETNFTIDDQKMISQLILVFNGKLNSAQITVDFSKNNSEKKYQNFSKEFKSIIYIFYFQMESNRQQFKNDLAIKKLAIFLIKIHRFNYFLKSIHNKIISFQFVLFLQSVHIPSVNEFLFCDFFLYELYLKILLFLGMNNKIKFRSSQFQPLLVLLFKFRFEYFIY